MRTLIIEDDPTNQRLMEAYLSPLGECVLANDGSQGIERFASALEDEKPFDLVCIDIMMPDMDGVAALKKIREMESESGRYGSQEAKVLMVSAVADKEIVVEAFKQGCEAYIIKPVQREELFRHLKTFGFEALQQNGPKKTSPTSR
ncbi:MAG: response regulator [Bdellovibrionota bacterium]|nr:MAG: response regulator [Bdellovibrionota bacterium]